MALTPGDIEGDTGSAPRAASPGGTGRASRRSITVLVKALLGAAACCVFMILGEGIIRAEPYLAVRTGKKCSACHVNPTGGGMRTEFGNIYSQTRLAATYLRGLPAEPPELDVGGPDEDLGDELDEFAEEDEGGPPAAYVSLAPEGPTFWSGTLAGPLAIGGDLRGKSVGMLIPNQDNELGFRFDEALFYARLELVRGRMLLYVDEMVAPGGAANREAYGLWWSADRRRYLKAGKMFLPYGFRIEDDTAFIRQFPGINYSTPDLGVEFGWEPDRWSVNFAVTNGAGGVADNNLGKQYSLRASHVMSAWRVGASFNYNDTGSGSAWMANVFTGWQTGRISWIVEADYLDGLRTPPPTGRRELAAYLAANVYLAKGHNLKLTYQVYDPDLDLAEDHRDRIGILWEYSPMQFTQLRLGYNLNDGIPLNDMQNAQQLFLELHLFF